MKEIIMKKTWAPQEQVFWYLNRKAIRPCLKNMQVDVVIVGGGMAGLSAAQAWHARGKKVILCEQYYCGAGATGKSSGFITPNAELSFTNFLTKYDTDVACKVWDFIVSGVQDIRRNILEYNFMCDYSEQDTLVVANSLADLKQLEVEHYNLADNGYHTDFYTADSVRQKVGSDLYFGGVGYEDTFGMNSYAYCQEMKKHLEGLGVLIFEETPVLEIHDHCVVTPHAKIYADYIVVCTDRYMPDLGLLTQQVYHVQTFLMASQVLSDKQIATIFPNKKLMVWDTDLVYTYFRMTGDNRLLLGGGDLLSTYASQETHHYASIIKKLTSYINHKFPKLDIQFEQIWPGLIGISKDIIPFAGRDKDKPYLYYVSAAAGLPIAAALGRYSAESLIDGATEFDVYFSPYRTFFISGVKQSILGKKASFAISNFINKNI